MSSYKRYFDHRLVKAIKELGHIIPPEIEEEIFPVLIERMDLMASIKKEDIRSCLLPILNHIITSKSQSHIGPQVLILVPTKESAFYIIDFIKAISQILARPITVEEYQIDSNDCNDEPVNIKQGMVIDGSAYLNQQRLLRRPLDFLVAMPGRLSKHTMRNPSALERLKHLIISEADTIIDQGQLLDLKKITALAPEKRQSILLGRDIDDKQFQYLGHVLLRSPVIINLRSHHKHDASLFTQHVHYKENQEKKYATLLHLLRGPQNKQIVVVASNTYLAHCLFEFLRNQNRNCRLLHPQTGENYQLKYLTDFSQKKVGIMVTTFNSLLQLELTKAKRLIYLDLPENLDDYANTLKLLGPDCREITLILHFRDTVRIDELKQDYGMKFIIHKPQRK